MLPLLAVLALVLARFGSGQPLEPLATVPLSLSGTTAAAAFILFSLTGFECAAVAANVTRNSTTTVPRATIIGTGFTAVVYLLTTVATLMLLPSAIAQKSGAPFADAIGPLLGDAAGILVALIAAVSAFGTANSCSSSPPNPPGQWRRPAIFPRLFGKAESSRRSRRRFVYLRRSCRAPRTCEFLEEFRQRVHFHHAGFDGVGSWYFTLSARQPPLSFVPAATWTVDPRDRSPLFRSPCLSAPGSMSCCGAARSRSQDCPIRAISRWLNGSSRAAAASPAAPLE